MFALRYFGNRAFAPRYFPKVGGIPVALSESLIILTAGTHPRSLTGPTHRRDLTGPTHPRTLES